MISIFKQPTSITDYSLKKWVKRFRSHLQFLVSFGKILNFKVCNSAVSIVHDNFALQQFEKDLHDINTVV